MEAVIEDQRKTIKESNEAIKKANTVNQQQKVAIKNLNSRKVESEREQNELKQELDIDFHKVPINDLFQRLGTNVETGLTAAQVKHNQVKLFINRRPNS